MANSGSYSAAEFACMNQFLTEFMVNALLIVSGITP